MPTDKEIGARKIAHKYCACNCRDEPGVLINHTNFCDNVTSAVLEAFTTAEQVRAKWPTDEMVTAAELKMPNLGRLQIRALFETMMQAAPSAGHD